MAQWTLFANAVLGQSELLVTGNTSGVEIGAIVKGPAIAESTRVTGKRDGSDGRDARITLSKPVTHTFRNMPVVFEPGQDRNEYRHPVERTQVPDWHELNPRNQGQQRIDQRVSTPKRVITRPVRRKE